MFMFIDKIIFFLLLSIVDVTFCWRNFKILYDNASITVFDAKYATANISINDAGTAIDANIILLKDIDYAWTHTVLHLIMQSEGHVELFNSRIHFCAFLSTKHKDPTTRQIYDDIAKYGKIFDTCPLKKEIYFLQDYHVDEELLPSYLPESTFKLTSTLYLNNSGIEHHILNGLIKGKIDKTEGFNNMKIFAMG